jgi:hypothetical protein
MVDKDLGAGAARQRIAEWMTAQGRPVLFSELQLALGEVGDAFEDMRRNGMIVAIFPEAKAGDSGGQFWDFKDKVARPLSGDTPNDMAR